MRTATHRSVGQTLTDDEGREFELPIPDTMGDPSWTAIASDLPDGRVLVSYLVVDDDSEHMDPSKEDCSGWQEFIVLHNQRDADELSSKLNDCAACGYHRDDHDPETNGGHDPISWIDCAEFLPSEARQALDAGRAFLFEKYEHGQVNYALRGESSQVDHQWDVTPVAGFMWADDDWGRDVDIEDAARNFLETYTSWCNGDVYGIVHAWYKPNPERCPVCGQADNCGECSHADDGLDDVDREWLLDGDYEACWGFIGSEYAETEMKSEHESFKAT